MSCGPDSSQNITNFAYLSRHRTHRRQTCSAAAAPAPAIDGQPVVYEIVFHDFASIISSTGNDWTAAVCSFRSLPIFKRGLGHEERDAKKASSDTAMS
ncbi:hypothetical protein [Paenibacillus sp. B2(2019)]|uniref:hypothetical protein n=1 Tax=Paenibacillus sp. B2(2019) TaxID=2607754 RepID=UPI001CB6D485|nr:hypothetical protein [Paenibacillus sp. B2(2019)]